ncbi:MAG: flagellar basal body rod protein FlgB [Verrucomicrobiota bacterium]
MIEAINDRANYQIAKNLLDVAHARQKALASNVANFENPGYKRIDVAKSFQAELQKAVKSKDIESLINLRPVLEEDPNAVTMRADGNNVSIEKEMMALNKNTMDYDFAAQLVSGSIRRLNTAIKGQVS